MGSHPQKVMPFLEGLEYQSEPGLFEVSDAAVDQFGGFAGGSRGEIALFQKNNRQTRLGRLGGQACAVDAAANDGEVDFLDGR